MNTAPKVVILGAGFAGLEVAQRLANTAFEVVLIDRQNYHTFQPLLHQVATAELEPAQVAFPIRAGRRRATNVRFVCAEITAVPAKQPWVETAVGRFAYDFLVIATGSRPTVKAVPGADRHSFPLKTLEDAIAIHRQILRCFEQALLTRDAAVQQALLTIAIVGGGATGVELAGAMAEWIRHTLRRDYGTLNYQRIRLVLLHGGDRLLPGFHARLQRYAYDYFQRVGVEVWLQTRVSHVTAEGLTLPNGEFIPAATVIWSAGVQPQRPGMDEPSGITVLPTLQSTHNPWIYALGDVAIAQPHVPMLAAVAVQQGRTVAHNLLHQVQGKPLRPFHYRPLGAMAILGRHAAVAQFASLTLTGFVAWVLWLAVHVALLRGIRHRLLTLLHWGLSAYRRERVGQTTTTQQPPLVSMFRTQ
ncbi:MAG: NAD(P)/FAD-dependent oxidoreductase [Cyanobacteria bacterium J06638_22]